MRASNFRPLFDQLDARIVLDATVAGAAIAATPVIVSAPAPTVSTGEGSIVPTTGWYQGGSDPSNPNTASECTIPIVFL
jgi:hypothetical protein